MLEVVKDSRGDTFRAVYTLRYAGAVYVVHVFQKKSKTGCETAWRDIDDKNGINSCKLLGLGFTTALAILVRSREKGLIGRNDALAKLAALARNGRYKDFDR